METCVTIEEWVSERGFTSKQRKKVIYGREKHREQERKGEKIRKVKRKKRLCCFFVWPLSFNLSEMGDPTMSIINSSQHSYPGQWGMQSPHNEKVTTQGGQL